MVISSNASARVLPSAGVAKLVLISDFPIDESLLQVVRQLWSGGTTDAELVFDGSRRTCVWPCRVLHEYGDVRQLGFHVFLCATFLSKHRKIVDRMHQLGCKLELRLDVSALSEDLSLAAATMKQLADLHIQLSFHPIGDRQ